jgi:hypothetical protein
MADLHLRLLPARALGGDNFGGSETMTNDKKQRKPRRRLPAAKPWAIDAEDGVKRAILMRYLRQLKAWGYGLDDIFEAWGK